MNGDQLQKKLQGAIDIMLKTIDAERMRPLQKKTYLEMAACFDNKTASGSQIEGCLQNSSLAVSGCQQVIQNEMNLFQNRLQRCIADCEDNVRDKFPNFETNQSQTEKAQNLLMSGMSVCVDKHVDLLKSVKQKIEADIDKIKSRSK